MTELAVTGNGNPTWIHTNVFANGKLIATYNNQNGGTTPLAGVLHFFLSDWLGTKRVQITYDGTNENTWSSLPFGDGLQPNCGSCSGGDASEQHFTGKERDAESGLDYFGARYYGSSNGPVYVARLGGETGSRMDATATPHHGAAEAGRLAGWQGPGRAYLASRRAEGSTEAEAARAATHESASRQ